MWKSIEPPPVSFACIVGFHSSDISAMRKQRDIDQASDSMRAVGRGDELLARLADWRATAGKISMVASIIDSHVESCETSCIGIAKKELLNLGCIEKLAKPRESHQPYIFVVRDNENVCLTV